MLDELLSQGLVAFDEAADRVTLLVDAFVPRNDSPAIFDFFESNLHDHAAAATDNLLAASGKAPYLERAVYYNGLRPVSVDALEGAARQLAASALAELNAQALALQAGDRDDAGGRRALPLRGLFLPRAKHRGSRRAPGTTRHENGHEPAGGSAHRAPCPCSAPPAPRSEDAARRHDGPERRRHRRHGRDGGAAGPGVFGTITALGSIDAERPAHRAAGGLAAGDLLGRPRAPLAVGQSVAVATVRAGDALVARKVVEILPLVGPVEGVDTLQRRITVMGTLGAARSEHGAPADRTGDVALPLAAIAPGDWLAVSGLWREAGRHRLAHRAAAAAGHGQGHRAAAASIDGAARIGGTAISDADRAEPGFAAVTGTYRDGRLVAERIVAGADDPVPDRRSTGSSWRRFSPATRTIRATICPGSASRWTRPRRSRPRSASARSSSAATTAAS